MDTKEAQDLMRRIYLERDRARGILLTLERTLEELEELNEAITKEKDRDSVEEEVADVFAWLCSVANLLDIDLSDALLKKYRGACSRCEKVPCECEQ
ncbi:MAG: MazG nucleotide pyrophosphohydrolase domain-containing protein [Candidatus Thorarchaeota archaeon]